MERTKKADHFIILTRRQGIMFVGVSRADERGSKSGQQAAEREERSRIPRVELRVQPYKSHIGGTNALNKHCSLSWYERESDTPASPGSTRTTRSSWDVSGSDRPHQSRVRAILPSDRLKEQNESKSRTEYDGWARRKQSRRKSESRNIRTNCNYYDTST